MIEFFELRKSRDYYISQETKTRLDVVLSQNHIHELHRVRHIE